MAKRAKKFDPDYNKPLDLDPVDLEDLIIECHGNVSMVARKLKASQKVTHIYIHKYPHLVELLKDIRLLRYNKAKDHLENNRIFESDNMLKFYLQTQGHRFGDSWNHKETIENINIDFNALSDEQLEQLAKTGTLAN